FQVLVHSPDTYGGVADGFLYVDTGAERDFGGDFVGRGFEVAKASEDVFGAGGTNTSGTAKGRFSFKGIGGDILTLKGKGEGVIENARLVELPLFLGILSSMLGENSSRHYFNEVLLAYEIADGKFKARGGGIEIRSPGIKLVGGGTMDFSGNLDIGLDPHIFDLKIPVIEQIFTLLKKGLAQIWIKGDLARPEVKFVTGAAMLRIGIDAGGSTAPLPTDLRKPREAKDLPPGPK
ncbi:MAG TPA: hypothetical protein VMT52_19595, partial [Planctomycetota bacterium]|nr:hypothetical protein [Planctomycetota bacterium]